MSNGNHPDHPALRRQLLEGGREHLSLLARSMVSRARCWWAADGALIVEVDTDGADLIHLARLRREIEAAAAAVFGVSVLHATPRGWYDEEGS